jgi:tRNA threonylcarbamoyladenosine biosynthesis protein TsaB
MSLGLTLALDGSTYAGSAALIRDRQVIVERQLSDAPKPGRAGREEQFMPMVADCLRGGKASPQDLARIVCGEGPGSFTSLRVAASIAKGLAAGAGVPLFAVSSLLLIVAGNDVPAGKWLSALPAMRGEVFASVYDVAGDSIEEVAEPQIIKDTDLLADAARRGARIVGSVEGSELNPHARGVARVIDQVIAAGECDINGWEPVYGRLAEAQVKWEAAHGRRLA